MINLNTFYLQPAVEHKNSPTVRQASVAIILRGGLMPAPGCSRMVRHVKDRRAIFKSAEGLQILFIQRAFSERDVNSGEIALPGGKNDGDESDYEAAIRETREEVGIDLYELESYYVGKLRRNCYMRKSSNGQSLYCSVNIFVINDPKHATDKLHVSRGEVQDFKWVPLEVFLYNPRLTMKRSLYYFGPKVFQKYFRSAETAAIEIGMREVLFGFTLFVMIAFLMEVAERAQLRRLWEHAHKSRFDFGGPLGKVISLGATLAFRKERVALIDPIGWSYLVFVAPLLILLFLI